MRIDKSTQVFFALALVSGALCTWLAGTDALIRAFAATATMLLDIVPQVVAGLLIAGFAQILTPREKVSRWLGEGSGLRGLLLAGVAGMLTPGGPFASFPLVLALSKAGADIGVLVAYLTAWGTISLNRLLVWEIPFFGLSLPLLRFIVSLPLPLVAGLLARRLWREQTRQLRDRASRG